jgi:hypothetical protein
MFPNQHPKRAIEREQFRGIRVVVGIDLPERYTDESASPLQPPRSTRALDENAAHGLGGSRKEMAATFPARTAAVRHAEIRFMNERRGLERDPGAVTSEPRPGERSQGGVQMRK